ncbi:MAG: VOC family protein [Thermoleophilaceae bacterium]
MAISKLDHIGIVVRNVDAALEHYGRIFDIDKGRLIYERDYEDVDADSGVVDVMHFALFPVGQVWLELIEPAAEGPMQAFLDRTGGGVHHIGITTNDIKGEWRSHEAARDELGLIGESPRVDQYGVSYWFLHPKRNHRVLFEVDAEWAKTSASDMTPVEPTPDWDGELSDATANEAA